MKKGATRGELYRKWRERKGADGEGRTTAASKRVALQEEEGALVRGAAGKDEVRNAAQIAKSKTREARPGAEKSAEGEAARLDA